LRTEGEGGLEVERGLEVEVFGRFSGIFGDFLKENPRNL
jgi:hypothetical protein